MGEDCALNINVPDLPLDQIAGIRLTRFAPMSLTTIVISDDRSHPEASAGKRQMCVSLKYDVDGSLHRKWRTESGSRDESDAGAIIDGFISVTAVHAGLRHIDDQTIPQIWQGLQ
jgi:broad specificity polyphosphatase/5'/3'-nucleotidase SurE